VQRRLRGETIVTRDLPGIFHNISISYSFHVQVTDPLVVKTSGIKNAGRAV